MKKIMAFVIVGVIASSASFAAPGPQQKTDCKDILAKVQAAKKAAAEQGKAAATSEGEAGPNQNAK
jgi:hypothetical protein